MSADTPQSKSIVLHTTMTPLDAARDADSRAASRQYRQSAAYQIGNDIRDATPELLARHVTEIETDDRKAFLAELIRQLGADELRELGDALKQRLTQEAA